MESESNSALPNARWIFGDGIIGLEINGEKYIPAAREFLLIQSKGAGVIKNHNVSPLPENNSLGIEVSKFPARVRLEINEPQKGLLTDVCVVFFADYMGNFIEIPYNTVSKEHCVINGVWHSLAPNDVLGIIEVAGQFPSLKFGKLSVGDYLKFTYKNYDFEVKYIESKISSDEDTKTEAPIVGLTANPYAYQKTGIRWLCDMARESIGGILADEMGLGKTLQIIALILTEINSGRKPNLVICPSTLMENWRREIKKFAPEINPIIHHGSTRTGWPDSLAACDVVITTYETTMRDESLFSMVNWGIIILDEAQAIKNPTAEKTKIVKGLRRRVSFAVTGTPVENSLEDLWSILDFSLPGFLGSIAEFKSRFQDNIESADTLRRLTDPLILRRRVADVASDLPPRIDIETPLVLNELEAIEYEALRTPEDANQATGAQLAKLTHLRQFCCHPDIVTSNDEISLGRLAAFSKIERLSQIISEVSLSREKMLIFTSYTKMANSLANFIQKTHTYPVWLINGEIPPRDRQGIVDKFSKTDGPAILVINPKAGGSGLNITEANHVVIYNPEWNPALEMQSIARAHRRGQKRPVTVHYLYYINTVEEAIVEVSRQKRELANAAVIGHIGNDTNHAEIWDALRRRPIM
jgi:SNF2 family DNA or RNA helicase